MSKSEPGVTFSISEIRDTIQQQYDKHHVISFDCFGSSYVEDCAGELINGWNDDNELHLWVAETNIELDERQEDAIKQQGYIED